MGALLFHLLPAIWTALLPCAHAADGGPHAVPADDLEVRADVRVAPGTYSIRDTAGDGVIRILADDVTVDLRGVVLAGAAPEIPPERYEGVGIVVDGCSNVRILGGTIRGFRAGIQVRGGSGHRIEGCDLSDGFAQRLRSTPSHEDPSDWLRPHDNDANEWLEKYGAALYLEDARGCLVQGVRVRRGQNGIVLDRVTDSEVIDCDASFLSGWGLGLWRSSRNRIVSNRFDWCVRGYSHGVYARGQDSAGILLFEQCRENIVVGNSAAHGGDGFFLYAGDETVRETGEGGSNGNVVADNDFSHAVANGIEATFSRDNVFARNRLDDCRYGVWAGYSSRTTVVENTIRGCDVAGVAMEHGSDNRIVDNWIRETPKGVWLWWDEDPDLLSTVFAKRHPPLSSDNLVQGNLFERCERAIHLAHTSGTRRIGNRFVDCAVPVSLEGLSTERQLELPERTPSDWVQPVAALVAAGRVEAELSAVEGNGGPFLSSDAHRGRRWIFVDERGPLGLDDARLVAPRAGGAARDRVHVLGDGLPFVVTERTAGVEVEPAQGTTPATLVVRRARGAPALVPYAITVRVDDERFEARGALFETRWRVRFHRWEPRGPGRPPADFDRVVRGRPIASRILPVLDLSFGGRSPAPGVPSDHFATVAETSVRLPAGRYRLRTVSDDGVRVRVVFQQILPPNCARLRPVDGRGLVSDAPRCIIAARASDVDRAMPAFSAPSTRSTSRS